MENPNRILHVVGGMNVGGQETFIMNLYRDIDRSKLQFDFLVHTTKKCYYDDEIYQLGGQIFNVTPKSKNIIKYTRQTNQLLGELNKYKAIHIHTCMATSFLEALLARLNGWEKIIVHSHSTQGTREYMGKIIHFLCRPLISCFSTHKFACSIDAGVWLFGSRQHKKVHVVANGIDVNKYKFNEDIRENYRKQFKVEENFVIGHIGRFVDVKNHDFLIEMFNEVHKKVPETKLILVGDGELKNKIEKKVQDLGLSSNIIFTGIRNDVSNILQSFDVFILPSKFEGLPIVTIEAQATGLNCIISDKVPKDVKISELVEFKSIKESSEIWANYIIENHINRPIQKHRENLISDIINAGYDINETAMWFENFYLD